MTRQISTLLHSLAITTGSKILHAMLTPDEWKKRDLESEFDSATELSVEVSTSQKVSVQRLLDLYGRSYEARWRRPFSIQARWRSVVFISNYLLKASRDPAIVELVNLYISRAQELLPVEFRTLDSERVMVTFRKKTLEPSKDVH